MSRSRRLRARQAARRSPTTRRTKTSSPRSAAFTARCGPGGLVVIDVFNPIRFIQTRGYLEEIEQVWESFNLRYVTAHDVDEARQVQIAMQSVLRIDDRQLVQSDVTELRLFFPQELRYLLETNAFRFLCFYGDFDVESTSLDGTRLIAVAQKS